MYPGAFSPWNNLSLPPSVISAACSRLFFHRIFRRFSPVPATSLPSLAEVLPMPVCSSRCLFSRSTPSARDQLTPIFNDPPPFLFPEAKFFFIYRSGFPLPKHLQGSFLVSCFDPSFFFLFPFPPLDFIVCGFFSRNDFSVLKVPSLSPPST